MKHTAILVNRWPLRAGLILMACALLILSGCAGSKSQAGRTQRVEIACAKYWKAKGYDFDPAQMTCDQMCDKAAAIKRSEHWARQGYTFDPHSMTASEMDQQVETQIFRRLACCMIWYVTYAQTIQTDESEL